MAWSDHWHDAQINLCLCLRTDMCFCAGKDLHTHITGRFYLLFKLPHTSVAITATRWYQYNITPHCIFAFIVSDSIKLGMEWKQVSTHSMSNLFEIKRNDLIIIVNNVTWALSVYLWVDFQWTGCFLYSDSALSTVCCLLESGSRVQCGSQ